MQTAIKLQPGTDAWHAERKLGIGGSECAAVLGLSKWATPFDIYQNKIGESEPQDETWEMARGHAMEPLLRQYFADTTGLEVSLPNSAIVHPKYPFMRYNPDGLCTGKILAEYKTASYGREWGDAGTDEIPQEYILQVQHGLACLDYEVAKASVSIGGSKPKYYEIPADKELQEMIIEGEAAFWHKVQNRIVPDPISNADVSRMYSRVNGQSIEITPEIMQALQELRVIRRLMKEEEEAKEKLEVTIKSFMGANEILVDEFMVPVITWKAAKGAHRIDSDRLKSEQPAIAAEYTKIGDPTRRFLVK